MECVELHRERKTLVRKLSDIQNAQQLINSIGEEINNVKNDTIYTPSTQLGSNSSSTNTNSRSIQDISTNDMNLLRYKAAEAIDRLVVNTEYIWCIYLSIYPYMFLYAERRKIRKSLTLRSVTRVANWLT